MQINLVEIMEVMVDRILNFPTTGEKSMNVLIDLVTMVKKVQFNYQENNGIFLTRYIPLTVGFAGTFKPTAGFTFGSQAELGFSS